MKRALALPVLLVGLLAHAAVSQAQSFHEKVKVTQIKKGGEVIGLRLKLTLRPAAGSGQDKVRISLGPNTPKPANASYDWHRAAASDPSKGYLLHQWPEIKIDAEKDKAKPVTLDVLYADQPNLKPGQQVEVISTWNAPSNATYWHVWGMQSIYADKGSLVKLPGKAKRGTAAAKPTTVTPPAATPTAAATTAAATPAAKPTAKKPTAKKPTAKKPTAKKPTATKPTAAKPPAAKPPTAKGPAAKPPTTRARTPRRTAAMRRTAMRRTMARRPAIRARARLRR